MKSLIALVSLLMLSPLAIAAEKPNIDRLASQGMHFTDAHSPAIVCTSSRYSLMARQMAFRVPLPKLLRDSGYKTAAVGKWPIGLTFFGLAEAGEMISAAVRMKIRRRRPARLDFNNPSPAPGTLAGGDPELTRVPRMG